MKHLIPQTMIAVAVVALVFAVGGCGSSSDDDMGTEPTPAEMAAAKAKECTDAGGRVEANGSCTTVAAQIAEAAAAAAAEAAAAATAKACTDGGGRPETDGSCTSAADVAEEVAMACTAAGGRSNADGSCTIAASLLTEAVTKAAATKATAIAAVQPDDSSGLGGTGDTVTSEIKYDSVKITDSAMDGDDDRKFTQMMDFGDGRTMHVRKMKADDDGNVVEEVVIVSTDIEPPEATPFAMVEGQELNADEDGGVATDDAVARDLGDVLVSTNDDDAAVLSKMMSGEFTAAVGTSTSVTHTFLGAVEDDSSTPDVDESMDAAEVAGSYNGAPGTYKCAGTDTTCTVMVDNKGKLTAASNDWIFTPGPGAESDVQDDDYVHYGFWLKKTTKDGATTYNEVATFAGSEDVESRSVASVEGTASYEGGAVGVYVKNAFDPNGVIDTATAGHFKADASLMAYFGQMFDDNVGTIAPNLLNTVTGTIDNFQLSGNEENDWSVELEGGIITANDGTASGMADGGGAEGSFNATFHGDVMPDDNGVVPAPSSVVGEFNANFVNGTVAGGFGAREMKEE